MRADTHYERGISELIGSLTLIGIVTAAVALIAVLAFSQPLPQTVPAVNVRFGYESGHITVLHQGGDPVPEGRFLVRVDGAPLYAGTVSKSPNPSGSWNIGDTLTLGLSGVSPSSLVQVFYSDGGGSSTTLLASNGTPPATTQQGALPSAHSVVLNAAKGAHIESGSSLQFRVTGSYSTITVNGVSYPISQGDTVRLVVEGDEYGTVYATTTSLSTFSFSDVSLYRNGIYLNRGAVSSIYISGFDQATSTLNLRMPAARAWTSFSYDGTSLINGESTTDLRISGIGGGMNLVATSSTVYYAGSAAGYQYVLAPAPQVLGITPSGGAAGTSISVTDLSGQSFSTSAAPIVRLQKGGATITAGSVTVLSPNRIQCTFSLAGAGTGQWDVVVINPDGQSGTGTALFTVTPGPLTSSFTYSMPASNTLRVTDTSTGGATTWDWNYGDGTPHATGQSPADHTYATGSLYTVNLTVSNGVTASSSEQQVLATIPESYATTLNAAKTAYLESGGVMQFRVTGSYSTITVNGVTYSLNSGDTVRLVLNSNTAGYLGSTATTISTFTFNDVSLYRNGVFVNRGAVSAIWVSGYDQYQSTLNLYMPASSAWTSLSFGGTSLINGVSASAVRIAGLKGAMNLNSATGSVYYSGNAAGYQIL